MEKTKKILMAALLIMGFGLKASFAQTVLSDSTVTDTLPTYNNLEPVSLNNAKPFPYPKVNPANIRLYARVWRVIDLRDSANTILTIPGRSLMEVIMRGIDKGKLTPYEKDDFKTRLSAKQGKTRFADSVLVPTFDNDGNQISSKMVQNEFNPDKITKFRIEEDVFFDKQRGRVDTRIVGLAPLMNINTSADLPADIASTPAFWLYFPQLRYALVQQDVSDPGRGIFDVTMDDVFVQHKFTAYLIKEYSPGGAQTGQLEPGSAEAKMLEQKIAELKKSIWQNPKGVNQKNLTQRTENKKEEKP